MSGGGLWSYSDKVSLSRICVLRVSVVSESFYQKQRKKYVQFVPAKKENAMTPDQRALYHLAAAALIEGQTVTIPDLSDEELARIVARFTASWDGEEWRFAMDAEREQIEEA